MKRYLKNARYSSHIPVLEFLFKKFSIKKILEFGVGNYSTIFFREKGFGLLISIDNDKKWAEKFINNKPDNHFIISHEDDKSYMVDILENFDLIFVDGHPAESRIDFINKNIYKTDILVFHDSQHRKLKVKDIIIPSGYSRFDYDKVKHKEVEIPETSLIIKNDLIDNEIDVFFK